MDIPKDDYFFMEWLIVEKRISEKEFKALSRQELATLRAAYKEFESGLRG